MKDVQSANRDKVTNEKGGQSDVVTMAESGGSTPSDKPSEVDLHVQLNEEEKEIID